ncbi:radial spoke head 14 homolog [Octopus sinensis]|uniref:Radial spoke head 14 homolog n=1 Tax=Octopus sinensis TaxID=2607531 RepID=A0A6P7TL77_9MOLL|nr:radial spoke head 14 homolog [Octopus sinensis]XP_029652218.1 radial spoke head 14 homolog [Octopus sinensis]XP_036369872.1 radial spoke head 14 homolog [Octopus sinensis]
MGSTKISCNPPPLIDPTRATIAFGDRALPRLNRELNSDVLITRQQSLKALSSILHDPEYIAGSLKNGIVHSLKTLLTDEDVTVRQLCVECLFIIASYAIGRTALIELDMINSVAKLFDDPDVVVRLKAHKTVEMVAESPFGAQAVLDDKLVQTLVEKLAKEETEIVLYILDTLHFCMMVDTVDALSAGAMLTFRNLLKKPNVSICAKAAICVLDLSVPLAGKERAVEDDVVEPLTRLLLHKSDEVRAKAAGALTMIAITTPGKFKALHALDTLVFLTKDQNSEVRTNALKALTCLSEAPRGRKILLNHVEKIQVLTSDPVPAVAKAASIALQVICWKP